MGSILKRLKNNKKLKKSEINKYIEQAKEIVSKQYLMKETDPNYWGYIDTILAKITPKSYIVGD